MSRYIHGETTPREVARLETQAVFVASFALRSYQITSGQRVLDLGCGVGAMTGQLRKYFSGVRLFAVDIEMSQLRVAQANHPIAVYVQADAAALPFRDETFDRIHASWLLEHVSSPVNVLQEVRRVLKRGGQCQFLEVDNSSLKTEPQYADVVEVMTALNQAQQARGGDPYIGRQLDQLFGKAGFSKVEVGPVHLRGDASDPATRRRLSGIFADILESVDRTLGPSMTPKIQAAAKKLRAVPSVRGGAIFFSPVVGRADAT